MITVMKELPATLLLRPTGMDTLATGLWTQTGSGSYAAAAPYAATLVLLAALPTGLLAVVSGRRRRPDDGAPAPRRPGSRTSARRGSAGAGRAVSRLLVAGIHQSYDATPVLRGVDLDLPSGLIAGVLGPSGCGKTTLLRVIAGFERASAGTVRVGDDLLTGPGVHWPPERRRVTVVPQEGALFPHLDVAANVTFGLSRASRSARRADELLELVGLAGFGRRHPHELSGGQQQRVALARALAPQPRLVLLDEPFSALDAGLRASVRHDVREALHATGATAVLVTHDQEEALSTADLVAVMHEGRVLDAGSPERVYRDPASLRVAELVGEVVSLAGSASNGVVETVLGRLPLSSNGNGSPFSGPGTVVLRPEQVHLGAAEDAAGTGAVSGTVLGTHFYGHDATVEVRVGAGDDAVVVVSRTQGPMPTGEVATVRVDGPVRFFPATAAAEPHVAP